MKKHSRYIILLAAIAVCFSCSTSVSTGGGTGTETVNTFAMSPDGTPASGAVARVIDARWWLDSIMQGASPVLHQAVADKKGGIGLVFPELNGLVNLQIDHKDGSVLLRLTASERGLLDTVRLKRHASYSGTFSTSAALPSRVLLAGTSYEALVDESGAFSFAAVAPGSYAVLSVNGSPLPPVVADGIALTLGEGDALHQQQLPADNNRLLIDNFESGVGPTSLGRIFPVLGWYVLSDSLYYYWSAEKTQWTKGVSGIIGHSPIFYDSVQVNPGGKAFFFSTILDTVSPLANALIGISLKQLSPKGINLSTMSGFSLCASGKGTITIRFESAGLDSVTSMLYHYAYPLKLGKNMQEYAIPADSLRIMGPGESIYSQLRYPWKNESKRVLRIEFEFSPATNAKGDSLYCIIDDFILDGVSVGSLLPVDGK